MDQFPPLHLQQKPDGKVEKLKQMFPGVEDIVVEMIMEESHGDFNAAADILLCMSADAEEDVVQPSSRQPSNLEHSVSSPFEFASAVLTPGGDSERISASADMVINSEDSSLQKSPVRNDTINKLTTLIAGCSMTPQKQSGDFVPEKPTRAPPNRGKPPASDQSLDQGLPELVKSFKGGTNILLLLRGPPGSGKTTLARKYVQALGCGVIFSTDDYFLKNNRYEFDPLKLSEAHQYNQKRVGDALKRRERLVIVDNTNTMAWEMRPYLAMGADYGYHIFFQEPDTSWKFNPKELAKRNSHSVPKDKIEIMIARYEKNLTPETLMDKFDIKNSPLPVEQPETKNEDAQIITDSQYYQDIFNSDDEEAEEEGNYTAENKLEPYDIISSDVPDPLIKIDDNKTEYIPASHYDEEETFSQTMTAKDEWTNISEEVVSWDSEPSDVKPKPRRKARPSRAKQRKDEINITSIIFEESPDLQPPEKQDVEISPEEDTPKEPTMSLSIDPLFAVQLQDAFGPPLEDSLLQYLNTDEILSASIPCSLAYQFYVCWQASLIRYLSSKPDKVEEKPDIFSEKEFPRTVLAPNAVAFYEEEMLRKAKDESILTLQPKKKPQIIVKSRSAERLDDRSSNNYVDDLELYKNKRNQLYRKAINSRHNNDRGVSSFYAEEARRFNREFKFLQKEQQMDMFLDMNQELPTNKLDLHFLTTGEAIKQLQYFIQSKEDRIRNDGGGHHSVEVITGRGSRSENGRSRIRPAVENWLEQKSYRYSEINSGALRVYLGKKS